VLLHSDTHRKPITSIIAAVLLPFMTYLLILPRQRAVMDVIGFLCVSLGSSTVQLHDSLGSRSAYARSEVGFSCQNGDRA
jgi:hypothetical protein